MRWDEDKRGDEKNAFGRKEVGTGGVGVRMRWDEEVAWGQEEMKDEG